jgi:hypothetical protein
MEHSWRIYIYAVFLFLYQLTYYPSPNTPLLSTLLNLDKGSSALPWQWAFP